MKALKKIGALLLVLVLVMSFTVTAFAAEGTTGKITVTNATPGAKYTAYKIFDAKLADDVNAEKGTGIAYYASETQKTTIEGLPNNPFDFEKSADGTYNVTVKEGKSSEDVIAFLKANLDKLGATQVDVQTAPAAEGEATTSTVVFNDVPYGYYYIDSTTGTTVTITSTMPEAEVKDKNEGPSSKKEVQEDSKGVENWQDSDSADVGQKVKFKATITAQPGAENYVLHDKMQPGLDYTEGSVKVTVDGQVVEAAGHYTVVESNTGDDCTFHVVFDNDWLKGLVAEGSKEIIVEYEAVVAAEAIVDEDGVDNDLRLQYGDSANPSYTPWDQTKTWTFDYTVKKTNGDGSKTLAGAKFIISKEVAEGDTEGETGTYYLDTNGNWVKLDTAPNAAPYVFETKDDGLIEVKGVDAGTYSITEIEAPAGYNKLTESITVVVNDEGKVTKNGAPASDKLIVVQNNTGSTLPSTGGIGTTIFYIVGGVLIVGAAIFLITKKRMSNVD